MAHDLGMLKIVLGLTTTDHLAVWCVALLGWFVMLRMSELLFSGNKNLTDGGHPLHMNGIAPMSCGGRIHWGDHVG